MVDEYDGLVRRILVSYPECCHSPRDLFGSFAREVAPTIRLLESRGVAYSFFISESSVKGWCVAFMPDSNNQLVQFVVKKWEGTPPDQLEIVEQGIVLASTPTRLLDYTRNKLGDPAP